MTPTAAMAHWGLAGPLDNAEDGNINRTFLVGSPPAAVLQWLNPIFEPEVNLDIHALASRLRGRGLLSPDVMPTRKGALWVVDEPAGSWRVLEFVPGHTHHQLADPALAYEAGRLVGRFHRAVGDWQHTFHQPRPDAHDTPKHMRGLGAALPMATDAVGKEAAQLASQILDAWSEWQGALALPARVSHGDLKISNLRFSPAGQAICLLDLDTIGRLPLAVEMGDAWRSWCNPAGESDPDAVYFDVPLFEASARGWVETGPELSTEEWRSLVPGIERICLELAARFCSDAIHRAYFREDRVRYGDPGRHNLVRATSQFRLAASARSERHTCERFLQSLH